MLAQGDLAFRETSFAIAPMIPAVYPDLGSPGTPNAAIAVRSYSRLPIT